MMTDLEIKHFLLEIIAEHRGDIRNLESEMTIGKGSHTYKLAHNDLDCEFELFGNENEKFSRIKVGNFESEYPEGTENYNLIAELLVGM